MREAVLILTFLTYGSSTGFSKSSLGYDLPMKPNQIVAHHVLTKTLQNNTELLVDLLRSIKPSVCNESHHALWTMEQMHMYLPKVSDMGQSVEDAVSKKPMETLVKDHLAKLRDMLIAVDAYGLLAQTHSCLEDASEGQVHKVFRSMFQAGKVHAQMELLTVMINQTDKQTDFRLPLLALLKKQMDQIRKSLGDIHKRHLPLCSTPEMNSPRPVFYKEIFTVKGLIENTFVALSELFNHMSLEYEAEDHSKIMKIIYSCLTTFDAFPATLREVEKTCTAATETLDIVHWPFFELGELSAHQQLISYYTVDSVVAGMMETSGSSGNMGSLDGVLNALTEELAQYEDVLPAIALGRLPDLPSELVKRIDRLETIVDKIGTLTPRPGKFQMERDYRLESMELDFSIMPVTKRF